MWRFGFNNPVDYNDNEVFCGGVFNQFENNDGKCGICGDPADEPSPQAHETGGTYGNKVITKTYVMDSVIDVEVELTANHKGRFQFKLCPVRSGMIEATQECLDSYPLTQLDGEDEFPIFETDHQTSVIRQAKLPPGLTCARCVLQWTWTSANSWGVCPNGTTAGLGCGPQETFRNCADVRIVRSASFLPVTDNPRAIMIRDSNAKSGQSPLVVRSQVCVATPAMLALYGSDMSIWCQQNCLFYPPNCPQTICTCLDQCTAPKYSKSLTEFPRDSKILTDFECNKRCLRYPHKEECPEECKCTAHAGQDFSAEEEVSNFNEEEEVSDLNEEEEVSIIDARVVTQKEETQPFSAGGGKTTSYAAKTPLYPLPLARVAISWLHVGLPVHYFP